MAADLTAARNNNRRLLLHPNSLPLIDLRLISQTDLLSLATSPQDDAVSRPNPKIDKSVFNESAGSRRQTFSRLRLAPPRASRPPARPLRLSLDEDNSQIVPLLRSLFGDGEVGSYTHGTDLGTGEIRDNYGTDLRGSGPEREDEETAGTGGGEIRENYGTDLGGFGALLPVPAVIGVVAGQTENWRKPLKVRDEHFKGASAESNVGGEGNCEVVLGLEARKEDPYQVEFERRTMGMRAEAELVEFLEGVGGEWASKRRKRKVVDAAPFGQWLPSGWRIKLCLMKRVSFFWLTCSSYISPDGQQFASYQEASTYLDSFSRLHGASQLSNSHHSGCSNELSNKLQSGNVEDDQNWHSGAWDSARPFASTSATNKKQAIPLTVDPKHCSKEMKYRCHKCTMCCNEPDELLQHLFSSHPRKGPRLKTSMAAEGVVKNGNYECQFCRKMFKERHRFYGHLGNHIKDYIKRLSASGGIATIQKRIEPSTPGIPRDSVEIPERMGADHSVAVTGGCMSTTSGVPCCESKRSVSGGIIGGTSAKSTDRNNLKVEMRNGVGRTIPSNNNVSTGDVLCSLDAGNGKDSSEMIHPNYTGRGYTNTFRNDITSPNFSLQSSKLDKEGNFYSNVNRESSTTELYDQPKGSGTCRPANNSEETFSYQVMGNILLPKSKEDKNSKDRNSEYQHDVVVTPSNNCMTMAIFGVQIGSDSCLVASTSDKQNHGLSIGEKGHLTKSTNYISSKVCVTGSDDLSCHANCLQMSGVAESNTQPIEDVTFDKLERTCGIYSTIPSGNEQMFYFDTNTSCPAKCTIRKPRREKKLGRHLINLCNSELAYGSYHHEFEASDNMMEIHRHEGEVPCSEIQEISFDNPPSELSPTEVELQRSYESPTVAQCTNEQSWSLNDYDLLDITAGNFEDGNNTTGLPPNMVQEKPWLDNMKEPGNNELLTGLGTHIQANEDANSKYTWQTNGEYDMLRRADNGSCELVQPSVCFPHNDQSNKGDSNLSREKFENVSGFEDLKSGSMGNMHCDMKPYSKDFDLFSYDAEKGQGFASSFWLE